jgi:hypothetical protein
MHILDSVEQASSLFVEIFNLTETSWNTNRLEACSTPDKDGDR